LAREVESSDLINVAPKIYSFAKERSVYKKKDLFIFSDQLLLGPLWKRMLTANISFVFFANL